MDEYPNRFWAERQIKPGVTVKHFATKAEFQVYSVADGWAEGYLVFNSVAIEHPCRFPVTSLADLFWDSKVSFASSTSASPLASASRGVDQ